MGFPGFGPNNVQNGDKVCILHGSVVPVVLRKCGNVYTLVGKCYFEHCMYDDWTEDEAEEMVLV